MTRCIFFLPLLLLLIMLLELKHYYRVRRSGMYQYAPPGERTRLVFISRNDILYRDNDSVCFTSLTGFKRSWIVLQEHDYERTDTPIAIDT